MKAITLHKIWAISLKNRSDASPEIAFLRLLSCLILYAFREDAAICIGKGPARFCIWLCVTFPWLAALLSAVFWQTEVLLLNR